MATMDKDEKNTLEVAIGERAIHYHELQGIKKATLKAVKDENWADAIAGVTNCQYWECQIDNWHRMVTYIERKYNLPASD